MHTELGNGSKHRPAAATDSSKYFVDTAISDIQQRVSSSHGNYDSVKKKDTVFFRLVWGGNVRLVRQCLDYMRENHLDEELSWATGMQQSPVNNRIKRKRKNQSNRRINQLLRGVLFLVLWVIFAISTPIFYPLHAIIYRIAIKLSLKISKNPKLPLVYAVLSGNLEMVRLFLQFGTTLDSCDSQGNNLYHSLADKSTTDPDVFSRCHQLLKEVTDRSQHAVLLEMITAHENDVGISPLEMLLLRGSMADFVEMTKEEGCMGRLKIGVSYDEVKALSVHDGNSYITDCESSDLPAACTSIADENAGGNQCGHPRFQYTEYEFDVTKYEQKDIYNKQSLLLHFLTSRNVLSMPEADISSVLGSRFLQKWMAVKTPR